MENIAKHLHEIVTGYYDKLKAVAEEHYSVKASPKKWSKREILGHLVDSAQNNIRRFVVAQYEDLPKIVYQQDSWVAIAGYQNYGTADLIELWRSLNNHAALILANMPRSALQRQCFTNDPESHTLEWLARDYIKHMLHHLHQILDLEQITYP